MNLRPKDYDSSALPLSYPGMVEARAARVPNGLSVGRVVEDLQRDRLPLLLAQLGQRQPVDELHDLAQAGVDVGLVGEIATRM